MRLIVAVVGKPRHEAIARATRDYEDRARRYWPLEVVEVKDEPIRSVSADVVKRREGERLAAATTGARVIICEVGGRRMSSTEFASWVQGLREAAADVAFVIGGPYGVADELAAKATARVSFSSWTLPHELARLVLAEQLYRAGTIVRGEPYHK
jgi:23S rRNA (pseudouridine1915-N3)-methyltransferase